MILYFIKSAIRSNNFLAALASYTYRLFGFNVIRLHGSNNHVGLNVIGLFVSRSSIKIHGNNNLIIFKSGAVSYINGLRISIIGDNNIIEIGPGASCCGLSICLEDNNNRVLLGDKFRCGMNTELAAIEGTSIEFGDDCMLSANIAVRTGDSHSIVNMKGERLNHSKSISIGHHTWIGNSVLVFKGAQIGDHSVVAGGSVVTGKIFPSNSIIGGNPAAILKEDIDWLEERI